MTENFTGMEDLDPSRRIGPKSDPRTNNYYKPPIAAYAEAEDAIEHALFSFKVKTAAGEKTLAQYFDERAKHFDDNKRLQYAAIMRSFRDDALIPLVYSGIKNEITHHAQYTLLRFLRAVPIDLKLKDPLPEEFKELGPQIISAAEKAFSSVVAEDRAKNKGRIQG